MAPNDLRTLKELIAQIDQIIADLKSGAISVQAANALLTEAEQHLTRLRKELKNRM